MTVRQRIKRALRKVYLDTVATEIVGSAKRLVEDARRRFFRLDERIIQNYLSCHDTRKLHIGCGPRIIIGWLNADLEPATPSIMHLDATGLFPFPDDTFDLIFTEHMIEHVSFAQGQVMLRECQRVLKPGGRIRISTPSLAFLIALHGKEKSPLQGEYVQWSVNHYVGQGHKVQDSLVINNFVRNWGHQFIYDEPTLRSSLMDAGFTDIVECELQVSERSELCNLENEARLPPEFLRLETFTLEAVK